MATITVSYTAAPPTAAQQADIEEAAAQWSAAILDPIDLDIAVSIVPLPGAHNAMCIPGIVQADGNTLTRAQAKLLNVPIEYPDAGRLDMVILVDSATPWITGFAPPPVVGAGQYSLLTTILHEMCHGLGILGLCSADVAHTTGTYSDTALINMLPAPLVPAGFFPAGLQSGAGWITPFASLFSYQGTLAGLVKGNPLDDYVAFLSTPGPVVIPHSVGSFTVLTGDNHFVPFTTCDHIDGVDPATNIPFLMNSTTDGLFMPAPDAASRALLKAIGWQC